MALSIGRAPCRTARCKAARTAPLASREALRGRRRQGRGAGIAATQRTLDELGRIGVYLSSKRLESGKSRPCEVTVFRLVVTQHLDDWKEKCERERRWLPLAEAAELAGDGGLGAFLSQLTLP